MLTAIAHSGGYVAGAFDGTRMVGASVGFLADHHGDQALHSHITGVVDPMRHAGVGRAIKLHQRRWAAERELRSITWTFDPLVRRNAWFNIAVLGADVVGLPSVVLRNDDRCDQRRRRVRPAVDRLGCQLPRSPLGHETAATSPMLCSYRPRPTSSSCAAPTPAQWRPGEPRRGALSSTRSTAGAECSDSHARVTT